MGVAEREAKMNLRANMSEQTKDLTYRFMPIAMEPIPVAVQVAGIGVFLLITRGETIHTAGMANALREFASFLVGSYLVFILFETLIS